MKFVVIHKTHLNKNLEVHGPFETISDAKSWMAQDLADSVEAAKKTWKFVEDFWNDDKNERYANCILHIKDDHCKESYKVQTWEIAEFFDR